MSLWSGFNVGCKKIIFRDSRSFLETEDYDLVDFLPLLVGYYFVFNNVKCKHKGRIYSVKVWGSIITELRS